MNKSFIALAAEHTQGYFASVDRGVVHNLHFRHTGQYLKVNGNTHN